MCTFHRLYENMIFMVSPDGALLLFQQRKRSKQENAALVSLAAIKNMAVPQNAMLVLLSIISGLSIKSLFTGRSDAPSRLS